MAQVQRKKRSRGLKPIQPDVAGVDIGATEHWVCGPEQAHGERPVRVFGATTPQLMEMVSWLRSLGVQSVAMESTHVYWIPLYELLESEGMDAVLVNARALKSVPGRKTDVRDCQWIQLLHSCGLLRGSFRPKEDLCQLRTLHRQRANLVEQQARCIQWMQKALDQMNVRVHRAVSRLAGLTGMKILRAIVSGERDPQKLAALRDARCKKSEEEIAAHLTGTWRREHLFNLKSTLALYDQLSDAIEAYDEELLRLIEALTPQDRRSKPVAPNRNETKAKAIKRRGEEPLRAALGRFAGRDLTTIDGISPTTAQIILLEVGSSIGAFPSEKHFVSWLRLAPTTPVSGGKPLKGRRKPLGASRVGQALRTAAVALQRSRSALGATYRRIARRKSGLVAVMAVARKLAELVYRLLRHGTPYFDIGAEAYDRRFADRRLAALHRNAKDLGLKLLPIQEAEGVS